MGYDPQRKHQRRRVAEDDGPAPVDALLDDSSPTAPTNGSSPETNGSGAARAQQSHTDDVAMPERVPPVPEPPAAGYAEAADRRLVIAVAGTVIVACVLLARRRRRRRQRG